MATGYSYARISNEPLKSYVIYDTKSASYTFKVYATFLSLKDFDTTSFSAFCADARTKIGSTAVIPCTGYFSNNNAFDTIYGVIISSSDISFLCHDASGNTSISVYSFFGNDVSITKTEV